MNIITFIFYVLKKVLVIPPGSSIEFNATEEQAINWYKGLDQSEQGKKIKDKVLDQWFFKLFLIVTSIWIIPYLRRVMNRVHDESEIINEIEK